MQATPAVPAWEMRFDRQFSKGDRFMAEDMKKFSVDTSGMSAAYANFCRVTGTPEELVLDFGLNTQMTPIPTEPVKLTHRLVMNYFTAKRLLGALHMAVQQHENTYGVL